MAFCQTSVSMPTPPESSSTDSPYFPSGKLEEAGLTEGEGMALSAHKQAKVYHNYAKRTHARSLGASRKRRAFRLVSTG